MANDRHCVKHDFYASTMVLVFFQLFRAALAAVQLLTWSCSAGVSPDSWVALSWEICVQLLLGCCLLGELEEH